MSNDVATVFARAQTAKAAYRKDRTGKAAADHHDAALELRYARWLARGGPEQHRQAADLRRRQNEALEAAGLPPIVAPLRDEHLYTRWLAEQDEEG